MGMSRVVGSRPLNRLEVQAVLAVLSDRPLQEDGGAQIAIAERGGETYVTLHRYGFHVDIPMGKAEEHQ